MKTQRIGTSRLHIGHDSRGRGPISHQLSARGDGHGHSHLGIHLPGANFQGSQENFGLIIILGSSDCCGCCLRKWTCFRFYCVAAQWRNEITESLESPVLLLSKMKLGCLYCSRCIFGGCEQLAPIARGDSVVHSCAMGE